MKPWPLLRIFISKWFNQSFIIGGVITAIGDKFYPLGQYETVCLVK